MGIKQDAEFGISGLTPQSGYTPYAQAIKAHNSTYARNGSDYVSNVFLRKEAQVQGVNTVKVWDCSLQCYDPRLISTGGSAVEGQYVWLSFLPFEDKGHNAELDNFLQYDKKPDAFGAQAWVAGQVFATAVNSVVAKSGPNGLTRAGAARPRSAASRTSTTTASSRRPTSAARSPASASSACRCRTASSCASIRSTPGKFDCTGGVDHDHHGPGEGLQGLAAGAPCHDGITSTAAPLTRSCARSRSASFAWSKSYGVAETSIWMSAAVCRKTLPSARVLAVTLRSVRS